MNRQSKESMLASSDQENSFTKNERLGKNMRSITEGMSDIAIVNKAHWQPTPCRKNERTITYEGSIFDLKKIKCEIKCSKSASAVSRTQTEQRTKSPIRDKLEGQKATAEMELSAKGCIESCPEFKLLFVPGYELDGADQFYEDPLSTETANCSIRRASEGYNNQFTSRLFALSRLEDETVSSEDKQRRHETVLCVSRYNGVYRERRLISDRRSQSSSSTQLERPPTERSAATKSRSRPRAAGRKGKTLSGKNSAAGVEDMFNSARNSAQDFISECIECGMTSSEDTDSLQGSELKTPRSATARNRKAKKNATRKKKKCDSSLDLRPTKFYDINQIAATYAVPCEEKMKERSRMKNKNNSPGKSFFSQRKVSLTKIPANGRPATAIVRKKKPVAQKQRPNTAAVDARPRKKIGD